MQGNRSETPSGVAGIWPSEAVNHLSLLAEGLWNNSPVGRSLLQRVLSFLLIDRVFVTQTF